MDESKCFKVNSQEVQKSVKKAKKNFERKIVKDKNKKAFYSYVKKETSKRVSVGPLKDGEELLTDNKKVAEMLNRWCTVFTSQLFSGDLPLISLEF